MNVRLISYTRPHPDFEVEMFDLEKPDHDLQNLVAYCARVSNPQNQMNNETSEKLLKYLKKHAHWSPFEMVNVCLEIDTTRDIAHQIVRHRSFSFQEFSQRYADVNDLKDGFDFRVARLQDPKNRQNSIETDDSELATQWMIQQARVASAAKDAYEWALEHGIAKEQARAVLPEGLTRTRLYMNGTLRSWIHYCDLRGANGTQKEHMAIAHACAEVIAEIYPAMKEDLS